MKMQVLALFALIFFMDATPVIVKLSFRTTYDEHTQTLENKKRVAEFLPGSERYRKALHSSARKENARILKGQKELIKSIMAHDPDAYEVAEELNRFAYTQIHANMSRLEILSGGSEPQTSVRWARNPFRLIFSWLAKIKFLHHSSSNG
jgi:hypothetical protein